VPTIAPSYIYAIFALIAVSSILISSFASYATTLRAIPEAEQLRNLLSKIASKGFALVTLAATTNSTSETTLRLPSTIGSKPYWIRLRNESAKSWAEGSLGIIHEGAGTHQALLPKSVIASGNHSSTWGPALLRCYLNHSDVVLTLKAWRNVP
jgi:hypothetical protein